MYRHVCLSFLIVTCAATIVAAQVAQEPAFPSMAGAANAGKPDAHKSCEIYFSKDSQHDMVVLDQDGNYMPEVKEIFLWVRAGVDTPQANLSFWRGMYKPTKVRREVWLVKQIKFIDAVEFQKLIDAVEVGGGK